MIRARFRLRLPSDLWIGDVSRAFPNASLRLLAAAPTGDRTLELGEIRADDPRRVAAAIADHRDVVAHELLHCDGERALSKYETRDQALFEFLGGSSLLPEFPLLVEDGAMTFGITATRSDFDAFGDTLDASGVRYDLLSVVHREADGDLLTDRQLECLTAAERLGYFEVPRDCTLAEVADALGVDTSTASETIRRGTARVLEQFLLDR
ncbi:helix-turn-helix domain-containing protein [Halobaculum litoreum]|uniref:Helix-turn-helix domain-containing protein n=1 Tax=Halobaculum litoreum TaxID=3031998 RepID=A0ABD5XQA6_9EURY